jgi:hypothetical protein
MILALGLFVAMTMGVVAQQWDGDCASNETFVRSTCISGCASWINPITHQREKPTEVQREFIIRDLNRRCASFDDRPSFQP